MLSDVFRDNAAVERLRASAAGPRLDAFVGWLLRGGYSRHTIRAYVPAAVDFMGWTQSVGLAEDGLDQATALDGYREHLRVAGRWVYRYGAGNNYYSGARRLVAYLGEAGVTRATGVQDAVEIMDFRRWLRQHRGLADLTVASYVRVVRDLIGHVGADPVQYKAASLRRFVMDQASRCGTSKAKNLVTALRGYLRFLIASGACPPGLDDAIPRIAGWRLSSLPRYLESSDVERVIAACDSTTAAGVRDRAVMLLLARLGLRASDVAGLGLTDLDWQKGRLLVSGKTRRESWIPLPQQVGEAVLDYLDKGRPATEVACVFINMTAPYRPITPHTVSQIARRAIVRAGVVAPSHGAHVFRHSAATTLLRGGVALRDIGAILRHDSIESTAYYAKVDLDLLRTIARPWPGSRPC